MKAAILTPAYLHTDHRLQQVVQASGIPWLPAHEHSDLPRIRSVLIEEGLRSGAERLLLIDADTVPTAGVLRALAEAEGVTPDCAVFGMYPLREGDRWSVNPKDAEAADQAIREGRSFELVTSGLGLCAIHRESLVRLADELPLITEDSGLQWHPFCVPFVHQGAPVAKGPTYYADDGSLCYRLRQTGTELWCDPRLRAGHVVRSVLTALRAP